MSCVFCLAFGDTQGTQGTPATPTLITHTALHSPRGAGAPGENDAYDFGTGAGFYVDATTAGYSEHYNMYTYITKELPVKLKEIGLPIDTTNASISGHSMGGHGAVTAYLREWGAYKSASGFSAILNPTACPWGEKAFKGYFGDVDAGKQHDSTHLIGQMKGRDVKILLTQVCSVLYNVQMFVNTQLRDPQTTSTPRASCCLRISFLPLKKADWGPV